MFPIPSARKLSLAEIADYWSREIQPSASPQELRDVLAKAWWRGELIAANGSSRLSVLREHYLRSADFTTFAIPTSQWVSTARGVNELVVRPLSVPVPNANPDSWTDNNCAPAFAAIAEQWKEAMISPTVFLNVVLTSGEFFQWIELSGYKPPTFWSDERQKDDPANAADATVPRIEITKVEPETEKNPYSLRQGAEKLACSIKTLRGHIASGALKYVIIGHGTKRQRKMLTDADLNEFIANQTRKDVPCPSTRTRARRTGNTISGGEVIAFSAQPRPRPGVKPKK
jgi:hypothetical protein